MGPNVGSNGCFVEDGLVSLSAASPKLLVVGCSVESESVVTGTVPDDPRDACSEGRSSAEPDAGLCALVAKGCDTPSVCRLD